MKAVWLEVNPLAFLLLLKNFKLLTVLLRIKMHYTTCTRLLVHIMYETMQN